jgi:hypothetical protein
VRPGIMKTVKTLPSGSIAGRLIRPVCRVDRCLEPHKWGSRLGQLTIPPEDNFGFPSCRQFEAQVGYLSRLRRLVHRCFSCAIELGRTGLPATPEAHVRGVRGLRSREKRTEQSGRQPRSNPALSASLRVGFAVGATATSHELGTMDRPCDDQADTRRTHQANDRRQPDAGLFQFPDVAPREVLLAGAIARSTTRAGVVHRRHEDLQAANIVEYGHPRTPSDTHGTWRRNSQGRRSVTE